MASYEKRSLLLGLCVFLAACGSGTGTGDETDGEVVEIQLDQSTEVIDSIENAIESNVASTQPDNSAAATATVAENTAGEAAAQSQPQPESNSVTEMLSTSEPEPAAEPETAVEMAQQDESLALVNAGSGLDSRESFSGHNLPASGATTGNFKLVDVYPRLRFQEALLVANVPGENRMVVVEQAGFVQAFDDHPEASEKRVILDVSNRIAFSGEQGLLGLAFDPRFEQNRYVYIYYTMDAPSQSVVSRLVWDAELDKLDEGSETILLTVAQPFHSHNAGMIEFGPDGYLYIALGDGGDGGDPRNYAQNRAELLGSLLRIDVHPADSTMQYAIPPDNPFVGEEGVREEIFAYGFRNPFRFSFDRENGDLWLGDVGQEEREEINLVHSAGNYGWRVFEGTRPNERKDNDLPDSAFTPPILEYGHEEGLSVIGGYVYRGTRLPALQGHYLYADFFSGVISALQWDGSEVVSNEALATLDGPTSFGETRDGDVLVVSRYQGIYRIEPEFTQVELPQRLSETGLFHDLDSLMPVEGFVEYLPVHPFWSDGAIKRRWIGLPDSLKIGYSDNDWEFPPGSVSVKHFEMEMIEGSAASVKRLETRVLHNTDQGWQGFSYRWNDTQSDAELVGVREQEMLEIQFADGTVRQQLYEYPGSSDCLVCHNSASNFLLGPETRQLNSDFEYPAGLHNQLVTLNSIGLLDPPLAGQSGSGLPDYVGKLYKLEDDSATLEQRARSYLDVNCSHCHQPGGGAPTDMDFRFETANAEMKAIGLPAQNGTLGVSEPKLISPGFKEQSVVWERINRTDSKRMPPVSSHLIDQQAVDVIGQWIDSL